MNRDHPFCDAGSSQFLLAQDRRRDLRRSARATAWLLDDELLRAEEFGAVVDISRGGLSILPGEDLCGRLDAFKPGCEWLVMLNDPTGLEPLADQRIALIRLLRVESDSARGMRLACNFVIRKIGRCLPARKSAPPADGDGLCDVVAGDLLDELADRLQRDVAATIRAEAL